MIRCTSRGREALRVALVALALTAAPTAAVEAQVVLTDGWGIYRDRNGVTHYIPPGYTIQIIDGEVFVVQQQGTPPPPPPEDDPPILARTAAPVVTIMLASYRRSRAEAAAASFSQSDSDHPVSAIDRRAGARFQPLNASSVSMLGGLMGAKDLEQMERDVRGIHSRLHELGSRGQVSARSFGELRGAALRVRRAVTAAVPVAAAIGDPARRARAALALEELVHQLEVLLPLLRAMEREASRASIR